MSYGLSVRNDSSYLQIDSESPRLCAIYNGTYTSTSRFATVTFPAPVTSVEPPCVFIRNAESAPEHLYSSMVLLGSSGNWTGFTLGVNNINWRPTGKWFCAVFSVQTQQTYGMRIWGESGGIIFDSGTTPVIVTRATNSLTYRGTFNYPTLGSAGWYSFGLASGVLLSDEYFMINPFSKDLPYSPRPLQSGVKWNYPTNELQMYTFTNIPGGGWTNQGNPGAVFARLPGT